MQFTKIVAVVAILGLASKGHAYSDGSLRRSTKVYKLVEEPVVQAEPAQIIEAPAAVQPVTVVEAAPVVDSRAETLRKARQNAELKTEQKIVEKLEEARLIEEQERAKKIFGENTEDSATTTTAPVAAPVAIPSAPATVTAPANTLPVANPVVVAPTAPAQTVAPVVTDKVEKIEDTVPVAAPVVADTKTEVAESKIEAAQVEPQPELKDRIYVGAVVGAVNYGVQNVRSNGAIGVLAGLQIKNKWAIEASYVYSNHDIVTFWQPNLYRSMSQNDLGITAKYEFLFGRLKPYIGAGASYIYRHYSERILDNQAFYVNQLRGDEDTHSLNLDLVGGAEFDLIKNVSLGVGFAWSTNIANNNGIRFSDYGLPDNSQLIEEMDMISFLLSGKYTF